MTMFMATSWGGIAPGGSEARPMPMVRTEAV
jgi:hypothetical protein